MNTDKGHSSSTRHPTGGRLEIDGESSGDARPLASVIPIVKRAGQRRGGRVTWKWLEAVKRTLNDALDGLNRMWTRDEHDDPPPPVAPPW